MIQNPLNRYYYNTQPINNMLPAAQYNGGMNNVPPTSQFTFQQQIPRQVEAHQPLPSPRSIPNKHRLHPYGSPALDVRSPSVQPGGVRRRISRACDQCNQLRTKCDGQSPCAHCVDFSLGCEYVRERKKRGKASRKDLALQAAAAAAASRNGENPTYGSSNGTSPKDSKTDNAPLVASPSGSDSRATSTTSAPQMATTKPMRNGQSRHQVPSRLNSIAEDQTDTISQSHLGISNSIDLNDFSTINTFIPSNHASLLNSNTSGFIPASSLPTYTDLPYTMHSPPNYTGGYPAAGFSPMPGFSMGTPTGNSPNWATMPSPIDHRHRSAPPQVSAPPQLRYPVLRPLLPHLGNIVPISLACELLDLYFASSSSAQMHPMSPYVLGFVYRKRSFLHPTKPRQCTPALLASILWVSAQTCDAAFLTTPPSARGRICQKLLELTVNLLKPLIHGPQVDETNFVNTVINGVALGGLGVAVPGTAHADALAAEGVAFGASGALDDVVTYIHLATVVSASEYKGASLRWWNAAWSLARELKLGRELPLNSTVNDEGEVEKAIPGSRTPTVGEEEREERRRIWWLVYTVDRHLSLCYNKPLALMDVECDNLLQPLGDTLWQSGDTYTGDCAHISSPSAFPASSLNRRRGPNFECTGHSIFGCFLPLMTILGEIVDLNHARNHPRFGVGFRSNDEWEVYANEITAQLEAYERSLKEFEKRHLSHNAEETPGVTGDIASPTASVNTSNSRMSQESDIQTRIVVAYGTHVMHVLHILLTGKWDPISLLDDKDLWISSQSFITATGHAVSAAEAIESILEYDPGLDFMPFFFGVYLLQGSFLLLLIADKLQTEASREVVRACESIVRAHEACVATLNTEYQRNFRKVMRSALAQVRGRLPEGIGEMQSKRRDVLSLYRWTGDGTGLAL